MSAAASHYRRAARRWRLHPFARASQAAEAKIVDLMVKRLDTIKVRGDTYPDGDAMVIRAEARIDGEVIDILSDCPQKLWLGIARRAIENLATTIGKALHRKWAGLPDTTRELKGRWG